jgi:hypothetical protein
MAERQERPTAWEIVQSPDVARWLKSLSEKDATRIGAAIRQLERDGPSLSGSVVKLIRGSRHHNMKELRSIGGHLRVLFVFDPRQRAILLVGGDKKGDWKGWYERHIQRADKIYDKHLRSLGTERAWTATTRRAGERSADAVR